MYKRHLPLWLDYENILPSLLGNSWILYRFSPPNLMFIPNKSFSMGDKAKFILEFLARVDSVVETGDVNSSFNWDWTLKIKLKRNFSIFIKIQIVDKQNTNLTQRIKDNKKPFCFCCLLYGNTTCHDFSLLIRSLGDSISVTGFGANLEPRAKRP